VFSSLNWKIITYVGCLLASKIWEDAMVWNIDFVERIVVSTLDHILKCEVYFLDICEYNFFIRTEEYTDCFFKLMNIRET